MLNEDKKPGFDPDFSPSNPVNKEAAKKAGVKFDPIKDSYTDKDGSLIYDRFGQPY